jgi:hypothetical protein
MNIDDERAASAGGDPYATWDASYVLGALSTAERHEYEAHLCTCPSCHRAVGELAGMPALLGLLDRNDIESIAGAGGVDGELSAPPPEMLGSLLAVVRRRRRARLLTWAGGVAAAAAVAIGVLVAVRFHSVASPPLPEAAAPLSMTAVEPSPLTATVRLVSHSWGTGIEMNCTYGPEPEGADDGDVDKLAMVAVGRDGSRTQLATWLAPTGVLATLAGSTSMPIDQIASIQVVSVATGDVLLQKDS